MSEFNIRADAVDVEQIMRQIRARIRDKRGVDYTEEQIQELARVRLEKFLDPKGVRSDLLEQFRQRAADRRAAELRVRRHRRCSRRTTRSSRSSDVCCGRLLKLFFSPNPLITALHLQSRINRHLLRPRRPLLRSRPQPGRRDDAHQHRRQEHPDARRVGVRAARLQRASRSRARGRRAVSAGCPGRTRAWPRSRRRSRRRHVASGVDPMTGGDSLRSRRAPQASRPAQRTRFGEDDERRARERRANEGRRAEPAPSDGRRARARREPAARRARASQRATSRMRRRDRGQVERRAAVRFRFRRIVKIAIAAQRYGADINGGAELHARYVAEHLARHAEVEVLTTCAQDYVTWANVFPPGVEDDQRRDRAPLPGRAPRDTRKFARHSAAVFERPHSVRDELAWLDSEGPTSPALVRHVAARPSAFDWFVFFSYRYYHAFHGARAVAAKAVLVPTAERDAAIGLGIFPPVFRGVRALMFNSFEERAMIQHVAGQQRSPGRRRRHRIGRARTSAARPLSPAVRHRRAVRDLRRAHRREQRLQGAVRLLSALHASDAGQRCSWC